MDITESAIIEEVLDPLMMGELGQSSDTAVLERTAPNEIVVDFGVPDRVFVLTVVARPRA